MNTRFLTALLLLLPAAGALARAVPDTLELPPLVYTAGRAPMRFQETPVAVTVVEDRQLRGSGAQRLGDVLAEQTGLAVVRNQFGAGVQVQGLSPDYTLILVDGEPMVGREGGTLNLDRIVVSGVSQVEILKGPASSLYGSEALGGVINLVTQRPVDPFFASLQSRVGTFGETHLGGNLGVKQGSAEFTVAANRMTSSGYDLTPGVRGHTAPPYRNTSLQPKMAYAWGDDARMTLAGRFFEEDQRDATRHVLGTDTVPARERTRLRDGSLSTTYERTLSPGLSWTLKGYATRYEKTSGLREESSDTVLSETAFGQRLVKAESFVKMERGSHTLIVGGGAAHERVASDYVAGGRHHSASGFAFAQEDWKPVESFTLQTSARFDAHQDYDAHLGPRVAALYRPWSWLGLRASVGNGFKAPTSQELYLDFTNAQVGYTVLGATGARAGLERLREQGQLDTSFNVLTDGLGSLSPENSWSFNLGAEVTAGHSASAKINVFRNNVSDLIESAPVALKTNGQKVYTYFNLNRIHTQGVETEAAWKPVRGLSLGAGYQYLIAEDEDVLERIAAGSVFKPRNDGSGSRPVQRVEYGGLFNRSRHTANLKAEFDTGKPGFIASLRGIFHGRYGYADQNSNGILDSKDEYATGYTELNLTLTQKVTRFASMQAGVNNLLDRHAPAPGATLPGRLLYAGIQLQYF